MGVNSVSNHNHAHHTHAARTEESHSRQEQQATRASTVAKEGKDTFERKPFNINGKIGNGQNVIYGGHISSDFGNSSAENTREPDKDPSERVYGSGVTQYEKTATAAPVSEEESKTPLTNSEKIDALIKELFKEPASEERNAKISKLHLYRATEVLKERGVAVVSDNKYADYLNGTESAAEYLNRTASTTASEPPIYKSSKEVMLPYLPG